MKKICFLFSCLVFLFNQSDLHAGGFQVNLQGQKQTGMGHVGTGTILDASSIFFNPGAVSFLDTTFCFNLGVHLIFPRVSFAEAAPGTYTAEMVHNIATPFSGYMAFKPKPHSKLSVGLGIYTPFGSKAQWQDDWKGRFMIQEINLVTIFIQPTVSYKLTDKLGIGLGFIYATGSFDLRKAIPIQFSDGHYSEAALHGNASGIGYNGGIFFKACEKLSIGINYRSTVTVKVNNGSANFTVPNGVANFFPNTTFSTKLVLPSVISVGAGYTLNKLLLSADINYVGWSTFDTLRIDFAAHTANLKDMHSARMYKNTFIIRGGAQYRISDKLVARLGLYYDITPVKNGYVTPDAPDANKIAFTGGASMRLGKHVSIDASLIYDEGMKRTDTNLETQFTGTFKARALIPGLGVQVVF
jgi:long-chain fatty acid transport protein